MASRRTWGGRGFGPRGTVTELMSLLATPEIRKEVKLSDEGFAAVDKLLKENEALVAVLLGVLAVVVLAVPAAVLPVAEGNLIRA